MPGVQYIWVAPLIIIAILIIVFLVLRKKNKSKAQQLGTDKKLKPVSIKKNPVSNQESTLKELHKRLQKLEIEYYGATTPLSDVAIISIMENQLMTVNGFDRTTYQQMSQVLFEHLLSNEYYMQFNIQFDFPLIVIKPKNHTDSFKQQDTNDEDTVPFMGIEIKVPTLPESVTEATVAKWYKKPGETVNRGENLLDLESDKATRDVPAPASGVLKAISVEEGSVVTEDQVLAILEEGEVVAKPAETAVSTNEPVSTQLDEETSEKTIEHHIIQKAPLAGTVYLTPPKPKAKPFVKVGDLVKKGDILCVIEAMKTMNEIKAEASGVIKEIHVEHGKDVNGYELLFTIEKKKPSKRD